MAGFMENLAAAMTGNQEFLTDKDIDARRAYAYSNLAPIGKITHWTQGLDHVARAITGRMALDEISKNQRQGMTDEANTVGGAVQPYFPDQYGNYGYSGAVPAGPAQPQQFGQTETTHSSRIPASIRYNNPGAQYPGPIASKFGSTGFDVIGGGHKIAKFNTPEQGAAAQFGLLSQPLYAGKPLHQVISTWVNGPRGVADAKTLAYINHVSRVTGLNPNTPVTPELLQSPQGVALAKAMSYVEAGKEFPLNDAGWQNAQRMAFGGAPAAPAAAPIQTGSLPQRPEAAPPQALQAPQFVAPQQQEQQNPYMQPDAPGLQTGQYRPMVNGVPERPTQADEDAYLGGTPQPSNRGPLPPGFRSTITPNPYDPRTYGNPQREGYPPPDRLGGPEQIEQMGTVNPSAGANPWESTVEPNITDISSPPQQVAGNTQQPPGYGQQAQAMFAPAGPPRPNMNFEQFKAMWSNPRISPQIKQAMLAQLFASAQPQITKGFGGQMIRNPLTNQTQWIPDIHWTTIEGGNGVKVPVGIYSTPDGKIHFAQKDGGGGAVSGQRTGQAGGTSGTQTAQNGGDIYSQFPSNTNDVGDISRWSDQREQAQKDTLGLQEGQRKAALKVIEHAADRANVATQIMPQIARLEELIKLDKAGQAGSGTWAKTFNDFKVNVNNAAKVAGLAEPFDKQTNTIEQLIDGIGSVMAAQAARSTDSNPSIVQIHAMGKANPTLLATPEGRAAMIKDLRTAAQRDIDLGDAALNGDPRQFLRRSQEIDKKYTYTYGQLMTEKDVGRKIEEQGIHPTPNEKEIGQLLADPSRAPAFIKYFGKDNYDRVMRENDWADRTRRGGTKNPYGIAPPPVGR